MFIGGGMATIGYYTNIYPHDLRTNATVQSFRYKSDNRGLHLNNLSYLGPIIMGVGGKLKAHFNKVPVVYSYTVAELHGAECRVE